MNKRKMSSFFKFASIGSMTGLVPLSITETIQLENMKGELQQMTKTTEERLELLEKNKVNKSIVKNLILQIKEYIKNSNDAIYKKTILAMLSTLENQL